MTTNANMQKQTAKNGQKIIGMQRESKKRSVKGSESTGCAGIDVEQLYLPWSN